MKLDSLKTLLITAFIFTLSLFILYAHPTIYGCHDCGQESNCTEGSTAGTQQGWSNCEIVEGIGCVVWGAFGDCDESGDGD